MRARKNNRETKTEKRKTKKKGEWDRKWGKSSDFQLRTYLGPKKNSELIMHQTVVLDQQVVRVVMDSGSLNNW